MMPPSRVARMADISASGTLTQLTARSNSPPPALMARVATPTASAAAPSTISSTAPSRRALAFFQLGQRRLQLRQRRADARHAPEQHAARAGHRVVLLAARPHRLEDLRGDVALRLHLHEAGAVDVEPLDLE